MSTEFAAHLIQLLSQRKETVATAESCTGGGICAALTDIPGSSEVVWGGMVTYSNDAKVGLLDVNPRLLDSEGAVSGAVAKAMAWGARVRSGVDWSVAVTGIAGPGGGSIEKPVGTVWIAWCGPNGNTEAEKFVFHGSRAEIRRATVRQALSGLIDSVQKDD